MCMVVTGFGSWCAHAQHQPSDPVWMQIACHPRANHCVEDCCGLAHGCHTGVTRADLMDRPKRVKVENPTNP